MRGEKTTGTGPAAEREADGDVVDGQLRRGVDEDHGAKTRRQYNAFLPIGHAQ